MKIMLSLLLSVVCCGCITKRPYHTVPIKHGGPAVYVFAIEEETWFSVKARNALARIVRHASRELALSTNSLQSVKTLEVINHAIKAEGFRFGGTVPGLSTSLEVGLLDCSDLTFIYLEIAHIWDVDIQVAFSPDHIMVVLPTSDRIVFWETLGGFECLPKDMISEGLVDSRSV